MPAVMYRPDARLDRSAPIGYRVLRFFIFRDSYFRHVAYIFVLTFLCYTFYHSSRRPISVSKHVLHSGVFSSYSNSDTAFVGWAPFDEDDWSQVIGSLECTYLSVYAIAMLGSGYLAERTNLRYFLSCGMVLSGLSNIAFGLAYYLKIHQLSYFMFVQVLSGIAQASGWPAVVTLIGNWWGKQRRGLIMGIWNAHTSVGNMLGSIISGYYADSNWGQSFIVPGWIMIGGAILVFFTLVSRPDSIFLHESRPGNAANKNSTESFSPILSNDPKSHVTPLYSKRAVTFREALCLPNVIAYSTLLFFTKLVSYTFLYWLPNYLALVEPGKVTSEQAAQLSVLFDLGGIVGGVLAGLFSDSSESDSELSIIRRRAITCCSMLALAAPTLIMYKCTSSATNGLSLALLFTCGLLVSGPYTLVTTAVSADLGTQCAAHGKGRALATVTAIIDATGSFGAALGPFLTGLLVPLGWSSVFAMLVLADLCAFGMSVWIVYRNSGNSTQTANRDFYTADTINL